jgi:hypothetical protein
MKDYDHDFEGNHTVDIFGGSMPAKELFSDWILAKRSEREAMDERRKIEDQLTARLIKDQAEGSETIKAEGYTIKITQRFSRKIDSDALQEIAAEHGLSAHLPHLFRWKPDIDAKAWKAAGDEITGPLSAAITTTPGRPSYSIELDQE